MARTPEKNQSERGQQKGFAPRSDPVLSGRNVGIQEEKGRQYNQQAMTHYPQESRPRLQHGMPDSPRLERSLGAALKQPGLDRQHRRARCQRHDYKPARPAQNVLLPTAYEVVRRPSGKQQHEEGAREEDALSQMDPLGTEQQRGHSTRNVKRPSVTLPSTESTRQITE